MNSEKLIAEVRRRFPPNGDRPKIKLEKMSNEYLLELLADALEKAEADLDDMHYQAAFGE